MAHVSNVNSLQSSALINSNVYHNNVQEIRNFSLMEHALSVKILKLVSELNAKDQNVEKDLKLMMMQDVRLVIHMRLQVISTMELHAIDHCVQKVINILQ